MNYPPEFPHQRQLEVLKLHPQIITTQEQVIGNRTLRSVVTSIPAVKVGHTELTLIAHGQLCDWILMGLSYDTEAGQPNSNALIFLDVISRDVPSALFPYEVQRATYAEDGRLTTESSDSFDPRGVSAVKILEQMSADVRELPIRYGDELFEKIDFSATMQALLLLLSRNVSMSHRPLLIPKK